MVLNDIEQLLEKYEQGETTLNEEQQLKNYFSKETVAPHLEIYKPMFAYFKVNQQQQFTKQLPLTPKKRFNYKWLSVAAVTVLMVSIFFNNPFTTSNNLTITDAELQDVKNAKEALQVMSKHLNQGTAQVSYLNVMRQASTQVDYLKEITNPMGRLFNK